MKKNVITPMRRAMRRGIASMLLICGMCQPALAEEQSLLTLLFNDGHKQSYVLASRPKVTFDASTLYVASEDVKDEYVLADVRKFVFDKGDGVDSIVDFRDVDDVIIIRSGAETYADLDIRQAGANVTIGYGGDLIIVPTSGVRSAWSDFLSALPVASFAVTAAGL